MTTLLQRDAQMRPSRRMLTSLPWPSDRNDTPMITGVPAQTVALFKPSLKPKRRRFLVLAECNDVLPDQLAIESGTNIATLYTSRDPLSDVQVEVTNQRTVKGSYVYQECQANLRLAGRTIGIRMGLRPNSKPDGADPSSYAWWQWCAAERIWSGPIAEAWRIGGHLAPYTVETEGHFTKNGLDELGRRILETTGDILHGEMYVIAWRSGAVQITAHFRSGYFHNFPKPIPAFPVIQISNLNGLFEPGEIQEAPTATDGGAGDVIDLTASSQVFSREHPGRLEQIKNAVVVQPWTDLRVLAAKNKENQFVYLDPAKSDIIPAGVSRSFRFNLGIGTDPHVARYQVPPDWYCQCNVIETDAPGPAAEVAIRSRDLIEKYTQYGGFDTGRTWRYLRRDLRSGKPEEDGAEWDGDLAHGAFTLAYQLDDTPSRAWETYLHYAYHAADIGCYHGAWLGRLEIASSLTAPLPKFRVGGLVSGYLETGDPYLLEIARALTHQHMAMDWALQPRARIGRDAYPLHGILHLWDHSAEPHLLEHAETMTRRLLATQIPDGGFDSQAGAGVFTGTSCLTNPQSIGFGSGLLSPIAIVALLDREQSDDSSIIEQMAQWIRLMLKLELPEGGWTGPGKTQRYPLIGSAALFTMTRLGQKLCDKRAINAVHRFVEAMNRDQSCVAGTHAFTSLLFAHIADAEINRSCELDEQPSLSPSLHPDAAG